MISPEERLHVAYVVGVTHISKLEAMTCRTSAMSDEIAICAGLLDIANMVFLAQIHVYPVLDEVPSHETTKWNS